MSAQRDYEQGGSMYRLGDIRAFVEDGRDLTNEEARVLLDHIDTLLPTAEAAATLINRSIVSGVVDPKYGLYVEIATDKDVWDAFYAATSASGGVKPPKADAV